MAVSSPDYKGMSDPMGFYILKEVSNGQNSSFS